MQRIILDTNVFMSGIFWSGPPARILRAWYEKQLKLVISPDILSEYKRVGEILSKKYPGVDIIPIIDLVVIDSELYEAPGLPEPVSRDPDDDKFIALALAANCQLIVSGDKDLLDISGHHGIQVLKPAEFKGYRDIKSYHST